MITHKKSIFFILLICICIIGYWYIFIKLPYGNNKKNIEEVIQSLEGYNSQSIEILKIIDSKNERHVGFLYDNTPSYIRFKKNSLGNYRYTNSEYGTGDYMQIFPLLMGYKKGDTLKLLVISNNENNVAKLSVNVDGRYFEKKFNVGNKSASLLKLDDLPKPVENLNYKFYDKNGNQVFLEYDGF